MVGTGNPLTVATAERYKIRANSFPGLQVTGRMSRERERGSIDCTVTSTVIRRQKKGRWKEGRKEEGADGWMRRWIAGQ